MTTSGRYAWAKRSRISASWATKANMFNIRPEPLPWSRGVFSHT